MANEMFAALPQPPVPNRAGGSHSQVSNLLAGDVFWVVTTGLVIFLVLTLAVWLHYRRKARLRRGGQTSREHPRSRRREKHRPITIAQSGGLPPLRSDPTPPSSLP